MLQKHAKITPTQILNHYFILLLSYDTCHINLTVTQYLFPCRQLPGVPLGVKFHWMTREMYDHHQSEYAWITSLYFWICSMWKKLDTRIIWLWPKMIWIDVKAVSASTFEIELVKNGVWIAIAESQTSFWIDLFFSWRENWWRTRVCFGPWYSRKKALLKRWPTKSGHNSITFHRLSMLHLQFIINLYICPGSWYF